MKPETKHSVIQTPDSNLVERARVIAVGECVHEVKEGDTLLFTSFGVDSIELDGEKHYFLLEDDAFILAVYEL